MAADAADGRVTATTVMMESAEATAVTAVRVDKRPRAAARREAAMSAGLAAVAAVAAAVAAEVEAVAAAVAAAVEAVAAAEAVEKGTAQASLHSHRLPDTTD